MELEVRAGGPSEPDYIIASPSLVIEVKAPGSKKGLFEDMLKAVKQIENSGKRGLIVLSCDHMVSRGYISLENGKLTAQVMDIILAALPNALF